MFAFGFFLSFDFVWKIKNSIAIEHHKNSCLKLNDFEKEILSSLNKDGVAVTHINKFSPSLFDELIQWKEEIKKNKNESTLKKFLTYFIGGSYQTETQSFSSINPLIFFSINKSILNIVNTYFGMWSNIIYLEMNETKLIEKSASLQKSQNFHRDPGVNKCIKIFIYLNDVEEGGGPFTYIKGSHRLGRYWNIFKQRFYGLGGCYPDIDNLETKIDSKDIFEIYGKSGSVIIADTTGIHRGGNSYLNTREMTTSLYYPIADPLKSKIIYEFDIDNLNLDDNQRFALSNHIS
jgi:hypothetical protein